MMKKLSKKAIAVIVSVLILISVSVGATVAYLIAKTPSIENSLQTATVSCAVQGDTSAELKSNITIKNTGNTDAYLRAKILVVWKSDNGVVSANMPVAGTDYTLTVGSTNWLLGSDGYYYYRSSVAPDSISETLISSTALLSERPEGYSLSVQIYASAIQSTPKSAVAQVWNARVGTDGNLIVS